MPLGVWNVRESIRELFRRPYERHDTFRGALDSALAKLVISKSKWTRESVLVSRELSQTKINAY